MGSNPATPTIKRNYRRSSVIPFLASVEDLNRAGVRQRAKPKSRTTNKVPVALYAARG
ncbi:MAG: hypothetical protein RR115_02225 [Hydrogenoanaerobacterium sp.]